MALTPVEILHTQFKTALRGYRKSQVDEFVRAVGEALEQALRERAELQRKVDLLQEQVDRVRNIESTISEALTLAQKSADEARANAHKQAGVILAEAEQARVKMTVDTQRQIEGYRAEIALLESARDRFESEFRALLAGNLEWLDKRSRAQEADKEVA